MSVALVTGATGLVGSHIIEKLLADGGWSVRALVRSPEIARTAMPGDVDLIQGDVLDEASFSRAAHGCDIIFHAAANIVERGGWETYRVTNVEGTRNAISAAERTRARLLHVSSVAVYGRTRENAARRGGRVDETAVLGQVADRAYYARSKRESEALVLDAHMQGRAWTTVVRPDVIYGRRDRQFVPRMAVVIRRGLIPLLRGGRSILPVVHAANVASGAIQAATQDVAGGKAYNLANDFDVSVRRFFELAGEGLERRPIFVPMPVWAARAALSGAKWASRTVAGGRFSVVSNSAIDFLAEDNPYSSERAQHELGWVPSLRPEIGVPDAFRWWKEHHALRATSPSSSRP